MIKVCIVDDQNLFLDSLALYLGQDPGIEVLATESAGSRTLDMIRKTTPDVLLLDLKMPEMSGLEVAREVKSNFPDMRIIILTTFEIDTDIIAAFALGCEGYILKDVRPADLILAVKSVFSGMTIMHPAARSVICDVVSRESPSPFQPSEAVVFSSLTPREMTIAQMVSRGFSNKQIADRLSYTEGTVKNYISRILQKTGCSDRTHLAIHLIRTEER